MLATKLGQKDPVHAKIDKMAHWLSGQTVSPLGRDEEVGILLWKEEEKGKVEWW